MPSNRSPEVDGANRSGFMDSRSYNRMRKTQSLNKQKDHYDQMIQNTEQRLNWLKDRQSSIEGQLRTLENAR